MADEKQQSAEQMSETLVSAMDIIAKNAVQGLQFDKTEVAEITDITNRANGDYVVFNGSAKYHAYTENTSYTLGTKVYVNIPNNDYSLQKTIIRKYNLNDGNRGLNYIAPWDRFDPASPDLLTDQSIITRTFNNYDNESGVGLLANYNKKQHVKFPEAQEIELFKVTSMDLYQIEPNYQNYEYMGLSADFRTILSSFGTTVGNYGLKLVCDFKRPREGNQDVMITETHTYILDTKNMVGSIYNFFADFEQQAVFELPNPEDHWTITSLTGYFFQNGDFWTASNPIPATRTGLNNVEELLEDNIFVKNIKIRFGHNKADAYKTDVLKIYTLNGETYDATQKNESLNERRVYLNWMHRNPETATDDDPYGVLEEIKNANNIPNDTDMKFKANIWWLRTSVHTLDEYRAEQDSSNATTNELIKLQTEYLQDSQNMTDELKRKWFEGDTNPKMRQLIDGFSLKLDRDYTYNDSGYYQLTNSGINKVKKSISQNDYNAGTLDRSSEWGEGWIPIQLALNDFYTDFIPDITRQYTTVRCIVEYGPWITDDEGNSFINKESQYYTVLYSNELQFRNLSWVADLATWDVAIGLSISFDDRSNGHYPIYNGTDGSLLNPHDSTKDRTLQADIYSSYSGKSYLNGQESLIWKVPKINSMINVLDTEFLIMGGKLLNNEDPIFKTYAPIIGNFDGDNFDYLMYSANNSNSKTENQEGYQRYRYDYEVKINEYRAELRDKIIRFNYDEYRKEHSNIYYQDYINNTSLNKITDDFNEKNLILGFVSTINDYNEEEEIKTAVSYKIGKEEIALNDIDFSISIYDIYKNIEQTWDKYNSVPDIYTVYNRLTYHIASYYNKSLTNNTISCFLIKNNSMVKTDVTMTFGQHGTAGTDYTFAIYFGDLFDANWNKIGPQEPVLTVGQKVNGVPGYREILFNLYDANNEVVELTSEQKNDIINKWADGHLALSQRESGFFWGANSFLDNFECITQKDGENFIRVAIKTKTNKTIHQCKGYVLQATHASSRSTSTYNDKEYTLYGVNFTQLFPIIVRTNTRYSMDASGFIYYSESGGNPRYLNDIILLRDRGQEIDRQVKIRKESAADRKINTWQGGLIAQIKKDAKNDRNGFPALNTEYRLVPYPIYLENINNTPLVLEGWTNTTGGSLVYAIPLVILQNEYQVPALNSWDGNLLIDEDNNRIMAATIAAGHKDSQNRFTGVIMGDVGSNDNISQERIITTTGLYGYHEGAQSFGFLENGTGFIGKSGTGRIHFDGTSGTIQSANYSISKNNSENKEGTLIDLDNGFIDMWGKGSTYEFEDGEWTPVHTFVSSKYLKGLQDDYEKAFKQFIDSDYVKHPETYNIKPYYTQPSSWWYGRWDEDYPSTQHPGKYPAINKWCAVGDPVINSNDTVSLPFWIRLKDPDNNNKATMVRTRVIQLLEKWIPETTKKTEFINNIKELYTKYSTITNYMYGNFSNHITLRADGNPYFKIETSKFKTKIEDNNIISTPVEGEELTNAEKLTDLIRIDRNNFYLQTADYDTSANTGLKIDLKRGIFDSRGKLTINGAKGSKIYFGEEKNSIKLGIDTDGHSYLKMSSVGITEDDYNTATDSENGEYEIVYNRVHNHQYFNKTNKWDYSNYIRKPEDDDWISSWNNVSNWKEGKFWLKLYDINGENLKSDKMSVKKYISEGINKYIQKISNDGKHDEASIEARKEELRDLLKDVSYLYDTYDNIQNYVNNKNSHYVNISNYGTTPIDINKKFWVNNKGELHAEGGEISDLYVGTLNFYGYSDENNEYHRGATGIRPKWMTFLTDAWLDGTKDYLPVKAEISKTVDVEVPFDRTYSYEYTVYNTETLTGYAYATVPNGSYPGGDNVVPSSNMTISDSWVYVGDNGDTQTWRKRIDVSGVVTSTGTGTGTIHDTKSVPYTFKDTWTAWSTVPAITSIVLHRKYISMWTLTNDSAEEGESSDYNLQ